MLQLSRLYTHRMLQPGICQHHVLTVSRACLPTTGAGCTCSVHNNSLHYAGRLLTSGTVHPVANALNYLPAHGHPSDMDRSGQRQRSYRDQVINVCPAQGHFHQRSLHPSSSLGTQCVGECVGQKMSWLDCSCAWPSWPFMGHGARLTRAEVMSVP